MKQESDGTEGNVSDDGRDDESPSREGKRERIIRGPGGFRVVSESTTEEMISSMGPRDRIMVVAIKDPELGKVQGTVTLLKGESLDDADRLCVHTGDAFHVAIRKMAFAQVCMQMWGKAPPEGTEIEQIFEISQRELSDLMESEMEFRAKRGEDAS